MSTHRLRLCQVFLLSCDEASSWAQSAVHAGVISLLGLVAENGPSLRQHKADVAQAGSLAGRQDEAKPRKYTVNMGQKRCWKGNKLFGVLKAKNVFPG